MHGNNEPCATSGSEPGLAQGTDRETCGNRHWGKGHRGLVGEFEQGFEFS